MLHKVKKKKQKKSVFRHIILHVNNLGIKLYTIIKSLSSSLVFFYRISWTTKTDFFFLHHIIKKKIVNPFSASLE